MTGRSALRPLALSVFLAWSAAGQVIQFESGGLKYQTLTKSGVTVMFAHMPTQVRNYSIVQMAVSNGSSQPFKIRPEDIAFTLANGAVVRAVPAGSVISQLIRNASGDDVIRLVTAYETGLYGLGRIRSTNGYEKRRQSFLAVVSSRSLKAAAAASAIAFVETELPPGHSTDGAVFYPSEGISMDNARLRVATQTETFDFEPSTPLFEH